MILITQKSSRMLQYDILTLINDEIYQSWKNQQRVSLLLLEKKIEKYMMSSLFHKKIEWKSSFFVLDFITGNMNDAVCIKLFSGSHVTHVKMGCGWHKPRMNALSIGIYPHLWNQRAKL